MRASDQDVADRLRAAFADKEPAAAGLGVDLGTVAREAGHRRRRRRAAAVTFTAVVVVAAAGTVAGTTVRGHDHPAAAVSLPPAPPVDGSRWFVTITPDWLPPGERHEVATGVLAGMQTRKFAVTGAGGDLNITVSLMTGRLGLLHGHDTTIGRPTTIGGRQAREWPADNPGVNGYQLAVAWAANRLAVVEVSGSRPAPQLRDVGRRVAASLREGERVPVHLEFTLGWLPPGVRVDGAGGGSLGSMYQLAPRTVPDNSRQQAVVFTERGGDAPVPGSSPANGTGKPASTIVAGRPVNGHDTVETRYPGGGGELWVSGFGPFGTALALNTGTGVPTIDELYRIAESARWVG